MSNSADKVRNDFDRIARLTADEADHVGPYDAFIFELIPADCVHVLEVGCGTGRFSRALAARGHRVTGIDLSAEMVRVARSRTLPDVPATFECADLLQVSAGECAYDAVVSIAMLHHVAADAAIRRMAGLVRPGGVLVIHDIRADAGVWDLPRSALALAARLWAAARGRRERIRGAVRAAWDEHGRGERYATIDEARHMAQTYLPGAQVYRHLQWRYTVAWRKPAAA
jgi:2-polyprenyl-3-methyl-5-hydroxy-6-metoxy-1,4-benzoquinol methylase